jgi:hypothetical protein
MQVASQPDGLWDGLLLGTLDFAFLGALDFFFTLGAFFNMRNSDTVLFWEPSMLEETTTYRSRQS